MSVAKGFCPNHDRIKLKDGKCTACGDIPYRSSKDFKENRYGILSTMYKKMTAPLRKSE